MIICWTWRFFNKLRKILSFLISWDLRFSMVATVTAIRDTNPCSLIEVCDLEDWGITFIQTRFYQTTLCHIPEDSNLHFWSFHSWYWFKIIFPCLKFLGFDIIFCKSCYFNNFYNAEIEYVKGKMCNEKNSAYKACPPFWIATCNWMLVVNVKAISMAAEIIHVHS
jgi:hypothetical protein